MNWTCNEITETNRSERNKRVVKCNVIRPLLEDHEQSPRQKDEDKQPRYEHTQRVDGYGKLRCVYSLGLLERHNQLDAEVVADARQ